jgi:uncharacterized protein YjiS (DUF1127 family)
MGALLVRRDGRVSAPLGERVLAAQGELLDAARRPERLDGAFPRRFHADPETVERGLAQLVLTLIELLRQLMERQALRRMENGTLDDLQIERLGQTFMKLAERMDELKEEFGLADDDLNLDLGPLGRLI